MQISAMFSLVNSSPNSGFEFGLVNFKLLKLN